MVKFRNYTVSHAKVTHVQLKLQEHYKRHETIIVLIWK